ncbi:TPA: hypothetical protein ACX6SK_000681 [Photobacterium damselae]
MAKTLDLTNTELQQCDVFSSDGVTAGPCEPKNFADILYIPQQKKWFYVSAKDAEELKAQADELDDTVKVVSEKLYSGDAKKDEQKGKEAIQQEALEKLNQKGILENYKIRSFTYFLSSEKDKSDYAQCLYTRNLIQTYVKIIENTSKIPKLEKVAAAEDSTIERYSQQLGLTYSDLAEDSIVRNTMRAIEHNIELRNSTRIGYSTKKDLVNFLNTQVIKQLSNQIEQYEEKAKEQAKKEGFLWYQSLLTGKYRFVKGDEKFVEKSYNGYIALRKDFNDMYRNLQYDMLDDFEKYKQKGNVRTNSIVAANVYKCLELLNAQGMAVPEQVLSKKELFATDQETQKAFDDLVSKLSDKSILSKLDRTGRDLTDNIEMLRFDSSNPKKLHDISNQNIIFFIEKLGYYNCLAFSDALDKALSADIQEYITEILGNKTTALNYGMGGIYILAAIRYQIDYLKYCANQNLKQGEVNFCLDSNKIKQSLLALDTITWSFNDIKLTEYKFAWKESDTHIVEFFIMSEENKPRYMISSDLNKLLDSHGLVTELKLKDNIDVARGVKDEDIKQANSADSLQAGIKQAIKLARDSVKNNQTKTVNLNSDIPDSSIDKFTKYTSLIQMSQTIGGGKGLSYIVNAQAELFRFCADNCRFEADYPESFEDLVKRAIKQTDIASIEASASIDILSGYMSIEQMLPSRNGFPMIISARFGEQNKVKELHLGQLRSDVDMVLYGSVGIGLSLSAAVSMTSTDGGLSLSPILPGDTNLPNGGYIAGSVDVFAGARAGVTVSSDVKWCKPIKNMQGMVPDPLNKSWIAQLTPMQANNLRTTNNYHVREDRDWHQIGRFCNTTEKSFGVGLRGTLKFGYRKNQYILTCGGGLTVGGGGYVEQTIALYPESLLEFVNAFVDLLASNDFRRLDIFTEKDDEDGTLDGNQVLNTLITMTMVTGLEVSQLALLNMNEVIKQEKKILVHGHADMIANNIISFHNKNQNIQDMKPWFNNMPPESRARLLYSLTVDSTLLDVTLGVKVSELKRFNQSPFQILKPPQLSEKEKEKLVNGINEEAPRWIAICKLLNFWVNQDSYIYKSVEDRQICETFTRFNVLGKVMLVGDYANKLIPYIVWGKLKEFLERYDQFYIDGLDYHESININELYFVNKVKDNIDAYFNSYPETKYKVIKRKLYGTDLEFVVFNGERTNLSLELKFGYYHLARSKVYPDEYKEFSDGLLSFINSPSKMIKSSMVKSINNLVDNMVEKENSIGDFKNKKRILEAIKNGDMSALLDLMDGYYEI